MRIVTKSQMIDLMDEFSDGGIVFAEYNPCVTASELLVTTDGRFGATNVVPEDGEVLDWDWNIGEYKDTDLFIIYDNNDVLQMIQTLTRGLKIKLSMD